MDIVDLLFPTESSIGQERVGREEMSFQRIHGVEFRENYYGLLLEEVLPALTCCFFAT